MRLLILHAVIFLTICYSVKFCVSVKTVQCASFQTNSFVRNETEVKLNFSISSNNCSSPPPIVSFVSVTVKDLNSASRHASILCNILHKNGSCTSSTACTCDAVSQEYSVTREVGNHTDELWELRAELKDGRTFSTLVDVQNASMATEEEKVTDDLGLQASPESSDLDGVGLGVGLGLLALIICIVVVIVWCRRSGAQPPPIPRGDRNVPRENRVYSENRVSEGELYEEIANPAQTLTMSGDRYGSYLYPIKAPQLRSGGHTQTRAAGAAVIPANTDTYINDI